MIDKLGGRKSLISLVAVVIGVAVTMIKGDIPAGLQELMQYILGVFIAGNVTSDFVLALKGRNPAAAAAPQPAVEAPAEVSAAAAPPAPSYDDSATQEKLDTLVEGSKAQQEFLVALYKRMFPNG